MERIERAEAFFASTKADIRTGGTRAFYALEPDYIQMPPFECFRDAESHAATLAHELTHWTRHSARLNRDLGRKRWGDAGYAMEELVAELGAAFWCADLSVTPEVRDNHANYIGNWLEVLKNDKRAIFSAASLASRAVEFKVKRLARISDKVGSHKPALPANEKSATPKSSCRRLPNLSESSPVNGADTATLRDGEVTRRGTIHSAHGSLLKMARMPGSAGLIIVLARIVSVAASCSATVRRSFSRARSDFNNVSRSPVLIPG